MDDLKIQIRKLEDQNRRMNELDQKVYLHEQERNKFIQEVDRLNSAVKALNN